MQALKDLSRNALKGALLGALLGLFFVGIGAIRALVVLLAGGKFTPLSTEDLRLLTYYVGGFGIAGAVFGAAKPLTKRPVGAVLGFMLGGVIVIFAIVAADKGGLASVSGGDWIAYPLMGVAFGAAAAIGWLHKSPAQLEFPRAERVVFPLLGLLILGLFVATLWGFW